MEILQTLISGSGLKAEFKTEFKAELKSELKAEIKAALISKMELKTSSKCDEHMKNELKIMKNELKLLKKQNEELTDRLYALENEDEVLKKKEAHYQAILERKTGGRHLHIPGVGITDITTPEMHIEIKVWHNYQEVVGQLLKYQIAEPRPKMYAYMYGDRPNDQKVNMINQLYSKSGIKLCYFADNDIIQELEMFVEQIIPHVQPKIPEDLSEFLQAILKKDNEGIIHIHKIADLYSQFLSQDGEFTKIATASMRSYLEIAGYRVSDQNVKVPECCSSNVRSLLGYKL